MSGMKSPVLVAMLLGLGILASTSRVAAQAGSIEFVARETPSGGLEEPVRGFPFYLLSKSFAEIEKEVDRASPKPEMNAFIEKLDSTYSAELKAWMKKNQCVSLSGPDFIKKLTPTDILSIPEFRQAYMERNAGDQSADFPKPKVKPSDQAKNPQKFAKLSAEYEEAVRRYIEQHPSSVEGIDLNFTESDPGPRWNALVEKRRPEIRLHALELAQSTYLVARAETDLQGQAYVHSVAPGTYWISTLDVPAVIGDAHSRWDVPVTVRPGQTEYVALSNANAFRRSAESE
jgi:hypothetical protein